MKKADKIDLAERVIQEVKKRGMTAEIKGEFVVIGPGEKMTADLFYDFAMCDKDRLKELVQSSLNKS